MADHLAMQWARPLGPTWLDQRSGLNRTVQLLVLLLDATWLALLSGMQSGLPSGVWWADHSAKQWGLP